MDGDPPEVILSKLKKIGIRSIALPEETLVDARDRGLLTYAAGYEILDSFRLSYTVSPMFKKLLKKNKINPRSFYIAFGNKNSLKRIKEELELALGRAQVKKIGAILEVSDSREELELLGIGMNPEIYLKLKRDGYRVIPRLRNSFRLTLKNIRGKLNLQALEIGDDLIIFGEEEVLGYPDNLPTVATELVHRGINFGYIEFSKQKGDSDLAKLMNDKIIRVHSISPEEMEVIPYYDAMARWVRACRERGIRVLYVHPFLRSSSNLSLTETNIRYVGDLKSNLSKNGFVFDQAKPKKGLSINLREVMLLSAGVIAATLLLAGYFTEMPYFASIIFFILLFSIGVILPYKGYVILYRKILAMTAAAIFPALAVILSVRGAPQDRFVPLKALKILFYSVLITLCGAAIIVGLLSDSAFLTSVDVFFGVKVALVLPAAIIAFYYLFKKDEETLAKKLLSFFNLNITVLHLFFFVLFLLLFLVVLLRSGNFGLPVIPLELSARGILEQLLSVRPRIKELALYPVLLLSIIYYLRGGKKFLWILLPIGGLALVSLMNTFCHIHSPILISSLREVYGIVFGAVIGLIIYGLYVLWERIRRKFE
ncbi:MAG: DUF5693 family protein [Candidatus Saganbacteria bacterium]|nr:DUF5693 family protein [Candidatus Saganbacteria bacterium]